MASGATPLALPPLAAGHADPLGNAWAILRATSLGFTSALAPSLFDAINPFAHSLLAAIARRCFIPALLAAQSVGCRVGRGAPLRRGVTSLLLAAGSTLALWLPTPGRFGGAGLGCALGATNYLLGATLVAIGRVLGTFTA